MKLPKTTDPELSRTIKQDIVSNFNKLELINVSYKKLKHESVDAIFGF